jgi:multidrug efflux pump subunit AcrB
MLCTSVLCFMKPEETTEKGFLAWMTKNHVAANLLMLVLIVGGLIAVSNITQEVFPEFTLDVVNVSVVYPGASPEAVEEGIVLAIEEEIRALENVERVTSVAREGRATISVELLTGADANKSLQDVKNAVDRISSLPKEVERPLDNLQTRRRGVLRLALFGDLDEQAMFDLAGNIREELTGLPEITQVELRGVRQPEVSVEISQHLLRAHGLTLGDIAAAIRAKAIDVPAGGIKTGGGEVLLRTTERRDFASEFVDIALIRKQAATVVIFG